MAHAILNIANISLTLRNSQSNALSALQHDANLDAIQDALNTMLDYGRIRAEWCSAYITEGPNNHTLVNTNAWTNIDGFTELEASDLTLAGGLYVAAPETGRYRVKASLSMTPNAANQEIQFGIAANGTVETKTMAEVFHGAASIVNLSVETVMDVVAGARLTLMGRSQTNNTNVIVKHAHLWVERLD
jgi:hypothetical protein